MATMTMPQTGTLTVSIEDISMAKDIKKAISMLRGVTKVSVPRRKARLYDPESGKYLNDETMQVIEDARKGKGIAFSGSYEEFEQWAKALYFSLPHR